MTVVGLFQAHNFELSPLEVGLFERFLELFMEYNAHTNLSAIRDAESIIEKHFIDSLYGGLAAEMTGRLLDIGSGGGFPGIPLKIVYPDLDVTLLDSVGKKVKAMNHFVEKLGFTGIRAVQDRAETLAKDPHHRGMYDIVVSRSTAYITDILAWSYPFLSPNGKIVLYKMPSLEELSDRIKIMKKLGLVLGGEYEYELAGKLRIISVFTKK